MDSRAVQPIARRLLRDAEFCRDTERRVAVTAELVERLPRTAADIELLLTRTPHRLSTEVQHSLLNALDFLPIRPVDVRRLLPTVLRVLTTTRTRRAFLWMKAGCLLGDGFLAASRASTRRTILDGLVRAVRTAKSVHARAGALHGIEHALNHVAVADGKRLLEVIREVALHDRAVSLRRSAYSILRRSHWWGVGAKPKLHAMARDLGPKLRYPE